MFKNYQLLDNTKYLVPSQFYLEVQALMNNYDPSKNTEYDVNLWFFKFKITIPIDKLRLEMFEARTKTKNRFLNFFL